MKKLLALVLALVMTLSLCTISNAAFTDAKDVNADYEEAVAVLNGMGVFKGYEDGSFKPTGAITRAEVAAIVYRLYTGDVKDKQADLYAGYGKFDDMAGAKWAAGYVGFCANAGFVKGYGNGKFGPSDSVTGYQALAMILRAVGYGQNGEFEGADWELHVAQIAQQVGALKNVAAVSLKTAATRELVAELLFRVAADVKEISYTPAFGYQTAKGAKTLGVKNFDLTPVENVEDAFGRPSHKWTNGVKNTDSKNYVCYAELSDAPILTYTKGVTYGELYTDLGNTTKNNEKLDVREDGKAGKSTVTLASGSKTELAGKGTLVEVYDMTPDKAEANEYRVVVINTYVDSIAKWTKAVTDKNDEITKKEFVTLDNEKTFETTAFTKDDAEDGTVVIYNLADGKVKNLKAAESLTLTATKVYKTNKASTSTFTADSTTYEYAENFVDGDYGIINKTMVDKETEFVAYFDNYGYVITTAATPADKYTTAAYILLDIESVKLSAGKYYAEVTVLNEKGEEETLKVAADVHNGEAVFATTSQGAQNIISGNEEKIGTAYALFALTDMTEKTGYYVVADVADGDYAYNKDAYAILKNCPAVVEASGLSELDDLDSKTVFFVEQYDKKGNLTGYEVYTGIQNVPSLVSKYQYNIANGMDVSFIKFNDGVDNAKTEYSAVLVENAEEMDAATVNYELTGDVVYVIDKYAEYDGDVYTYEAIVNGEKTTVDSEQRLYLGELYYVVSYVKGTKTIKYAVEGSVLDDLVLNDTNWTGVFFNNTVLYGTDGDKIAVADDVVIVNANTGKTLEMDDLKVGTRVLLGLDKTYYFNTMSNHMEELLMFSEGYPVVKYIIVPVEELGFTVKFDNAAVANGDTVNTVDGDHDIEVVLNNKYLTDYVVKVGDAEQTMTNDKCTLTVAAGETYTVKVTATADNNATKTLTFTVKGNGNFTLTVPVGGTGASRGTHKVNGTDWAGDKGSVTNLKTGDKVVVNYTAQEGYNILTNASKEYTVDTADLTAEAATTEEQSMTYTVKYVTTNGAELYTADPVTVLAKTDATYTDAFNGFEVVANLTNQNYSVEGVKAAETDGTATAFNKVAVTFEDKAEKVIVFQCVENDFTVTLGTVTGDSWTSHGSISGTMSFVTASNGTVKVMVTVSDNSDNHHVTGVKIALDNNQLTAQAATYDNGVYTYTFNGVTGNVTANAWIQTEVDD